MIFMVGRQDYSPRCAALALRVAVAVRRRSLAALTLRSSRTWNQGIMSLTSKLLIDMHNPKNRNGFFGVVIRRFRPSEPPSETLSEPLA